MVSFTMGFDSYKKRFFVQAWQRTYSPFSRKLQQIPRPATFFDTADEASEYMSKKMREEYAQNKESEDILQ